MKRVLISGGAGFIGSNLANKLSNLGYKVRVFDNLSKQIHGDNPLSNSPLYLSLEKGIEFIHGDVVSNDDWQIAIKDIEVIFHFAAETGTGQSMYQINQYTDVNIKGTANLLDILSNHSHSVKKVILSSSRAVYGEGNYFCEMHGVVSPLPRSFSDLSVGNFDCRCPICGKNVIVDSTDEMAILNPSSYYGATKLTQELLMQTVFRSINVPLIILRFQNVYGPGQSLKNPYTGILSIFSTQILNGKDINIFEDGLESRDFVYIDDVVNACLLAMENANIDNSTFNVGFGKPISVFEVAEHLKKEYNSKINLNITGNFRVGDIRHNYANISMANRLLGFSPSVNFNDGIKSFCNWVKSQPVQFDASDYALDILRSKKLSKNN